MSRTNTLHFFNFSVCFVNIILTLFFLMKLADRLSQLLETIHANTLAPYETGAADRSKLPIASDHI